MWARTSVYRARGLPCVDIVAFGVLPGYQLQAWLIKQDTLTDKAEGIKAACKKHRLTSQALAQHYHHDGAKTWYQTIFGKKLGKKVRHIFDCQLETHKAMGAKGWGKTTSTTPAPAIASDGITSTGPALLPPRHRRTALVVVTVPEEASQYSLPCAEKEVKMWKTELQDGGHQCDVLETPSYEAIKDALEHGSYQWLVFVGHGDAMHDSQRAVRLIQPDGTQELLTAQDLGTLLKQYGESVELVVVNACCSAEVVSVGGLQTSFTRALVHHGSVPQVIGWPAPVGDQAAYSFCCSLSKRLVEEMESLAGEIDTAPHGYELGTATTDGENFAQRRRERICKAFKRALDETTWNPRPILAPDAPGTAV